MKKEDDWIGKGSGDIERLRHVLERIVEDDDNKPFTDLIREEFNECFMGFFVKYGLPMICFFLSYGLIEDCNRPQTRKICEYQGRDKDGLYESLRFITTSRAKSDTSGVYPIEFATQFDGQIRYRKLSKEALENVFREYHWPKVDDIGFKD